MKKLTIIELTLIYICLIDKGRGWDENYKIVQLFISIPHILSLRSKIMHGGMRALCAVC